MGTVGSMQVVSLETPLPSHVHASHARHRQPSELLGEEGVHAFTDADADTDMAAGAGASGDASASEAQGQGGHTAEHAAEHATVGEPEAKANGGNLAKGGWKRHF